MKKRHLRFRVIAGYVILQLPGVALLILVLILVRRLINLPEWLVWLFVAIWIAKEVTMFPSFGAHTTKDPVAEPPC